MTHARIPDADTQPPAMTIERASSFSADTHGRRNVLGAILSFPFIVGLPAQAAVAPIDRGLILAVEAALTVGTEMNVLAIREDWDAVRIDAAGDRYRALVRTACAIPAVTAAGRAAKARLVIDQNRGEQDGYDESNDILGSLLRDLVGVSAA